MYNKFRWWTKGRARKPLSERAPLLLKIRNGDFDYSYMFDEAKAVRKEASRVYENAYKNYKGTDEKNRIEAAMDSARMKRVKAVKLDIEAGLNEERILLRLRKELEKEFEIDLWDEAIDNVVGSIEDLYWWYKQKIGEVITKSELDIQMKRNNTRGLNYLF